jgi:hypothetical protein
LLVGRPPVWQELSEVITGVKMPPTYYVSNNVKSFFERGNKHSSETHGPQITPALKIIPEINPPEEIIIEAKKEPVISNPPIISTPIEPLKYDSLPPPVTDKTIANIAPSSSKKEITYLKPKLPKGNPKISRCAGGATKTQLKVSDDGMVTYISRCSGKENYAVLIQNYRWTSTGMALQEMALTGEKNHSLDQLKKSGLVKQYWPERKGEDNRPMYSSKASKRRKNERRILEMNSEGEKVLGLISQK